MKHSGSTALALWSLVLKLSISIKHRHLNNSDMSCCTLLCCTVLNSLLSITNIIIFSLNLQSALTTDFINHHNVLLCRLNVGYAAKLNVASWSSTTVICDFDNMLLSSSPFSSVVCRTKAPPTGVGDVLQLSQSDSLGSCARDVKSG